MSNPRKYLAIFGSAAVVLVVVAVVALEMPAGGETLKTAAGQLGLGRLADPAGTKEPNVRQVASLGPLVMLEWSEPLPPDAKSVPDERLLRLAGMVDLANARYAHPDKKQWSAAMPLAVNLMTGPCDCGQRNWLAHYVEMGSFALSDSRHQYQASAELMATLALENDDRALATDEADKAIALAPDALDAMAVRAALELIADRSPEAWFA